MEKNLIKIVENNKQGLFYMEIYLYAMINYFIVIEW